MKQEIAWEGLEQLGLSINSRTMLTLLQEYTLKLILRHRILLKKLIKQFRVLMVLTLRDVIGAHLLIACHQVPVLKICRLIVLVLLLLLHGWIELIDPLIESDVYRWCRLQQGIRCPTT